MAPGNPYRELPSVAELSAHFPDVPLRRDLMTRFLQEFLQRQRESIRRHEPKTRDDIIQAARSELDSFNSRRLTPVINATGVVLHTNLGRAQVSNAAAQAMSDAARGAVALEIDPESNSRGGRMSEISSLMRLLTGAETTLVVNNNAAAVLLVVSALAQNRSVIVSRGEAIEIGGGFRIPDVMTQSSARLVEVGTTNRTYPGDYEAAIDDSTAVLLKVHASNFRMTGFTASASVGALAAIANRTSCVVVEDLGSGALLDTGRFGLEREPLIDESIKAGVAVVMASGDKLLGGPQAGIIAGRAELVHRIERHPLARAFRADKTCLAGIAATLRHYVRGDAEQSIPVWRMIATPVAELAERARSIQQELSVSSVYVDVVETRSTVGGGSLPGQEQDSHAISIAGGSDPVAEIARRMRTGIPGLFGRVDNDRLLLDLRTVLPDQDNAVTAAVLSAIDAGRRL
jgi:L-seryl-tRNA(Ser) seleniumtransferase